MFQAEVKEKEKTELELHGKKFEDVQEFLKCIYPSVMKEVTLRNAHQVVAMAVEYQVLALKSKCEACFLKSVGQKTSAKVLCSLIHLACLYSLHSLFKKCTTLAAEMSLADLDEAESQNPIPSEAKIVIQRKIIDKMESKQAATNTMVDKISVELNRVVALNEYHRSGVPKDEQLSFDYYKGWSGRSVFLTVETDLLLGSGKDMYMELCGTQLRLTLKTLDLSLWDRQVSLAISASKTEVQTSTIKIVGRAVIVNGLNGKNNFYKVFSADLGISRSSEELKIIDYWELLNEGNGYIFHGKFEFEVHILAQKIKPMFKQYLKFP